MCLSSLIKWNINAADDQLLAWTQAVNVISMTYADRQVLLEQAECMRAWLGAVVEQYSRQAQHVRALSCGLHLC